MRYPQAFLALQLTFAQKMAQLAQQPYQDSVRVHTALYRIFGLDWDLNPVHPVWQEYLQGLPPLYDAQQVSDWTYNFYLAHIQAIPEYSLPTWGCFSYDYSEETQVVHLHFANLDYSGYGPLSLQRLEARRADLWSLFMHIKRFHPLAVSVQGSSWLYNRTAYTRLFPPIYGQSARPGQQGLIGRGLWGQFLRHDKQLNDVLAAQFLQQVGQLQDAEQYIQCFPYLLMTTQAPIDVFYTFYGIKG